MGCIPDTPSSGTVPNVSSPDAVAAAKATQLTDGEKDFIAKSISLQLKEPNDMLYIWSPLVGVSDDNNWYAYCGSGDFKNIHDGHTGFVPFTALLRKDESGRIVEVKLRNIALNKNSVKDDYDYCLSHGYNRRKPIWP